MFDGTRAEAVRKVHRHHRSVKRNHPGALHDGVKQKGLVRIANERLWRASDCREVEQRQNPSASVAAPRGKNGAHRVISKGFLKLARSVLIGTRQNAGSSKHALGNLDAKS